MMLSVYFTTTEVYRPPTLDRTEVQRDVCYQKKVINYKFEKTEDNLKTLPVTLCSTYRLQSTPRACIQRRSLCPGPFHHPSCKPQSGWQQCPTGTSGYFSPKEMCLSSSVPSQSTPLETHTLRIFQCQLKFNNLILENILKKKIAK